MHNDKEPIFKNIDNLIDMINTIRGDSYYIHQTIDTNKTSTGLGLWLRLKYYVSSVELNKIMEMIDNEIMELMDDNVVQYDVEVCQDDRVFDKEHNMIIELSITIFDNIGIYVAKNNRNANNGE